MNWWDATIAYCDHYEWEFFIADMHIMAPIVPTQAALNLSAACNTACKSLDMKKKEEYFVVFLFSVFWAVLGTSEMAHVCYLYVFPTGSHFSLSLYADITKQTNLSQVFFFV